MVNKEKQIKLSDEWYIKPDPHCWILVFHSKEINKKKGVRRDPANFRYCVSIQSALKYYVQEILKTKSDSIEGLIKAVEELNAQIKSLEVKA